MTAAKELDFSNHINEMSRVLKKDAWIIASVPKKVRLYLKIVYRLN